MRQLFSLAGMLCICAVSAQTLQISKDGKSDYVIVVPDNPAPVVKTAASELAVHLKGVIGQELPVVAEAARPAGKPAFVIGPAKAAAVVFKDPTFAKAKYDEIAIKFSGKDIYLNGHRQRGALYAVYTFLEDYVGVCWWTRTESYIPSKPTLEVAAKDHEYAPKIICRETYYMQSQTPDFAPRLKDNGHHSGIPASHGGYCLIIGLCHTFYQFLPPSKYFAAHPEWYSEINGKRQAGRNQLCLTNDEMRAEFTKVALEQIRKHPNSNIISVSQNDWDGRCQCAKCKAIEEEEGSPSGLILRFVNAVAADIEKQYPDYLIETLAYNYTRKAPKITKPAKNVVIRLCAVDVNTAQPLESSPDNATFRKDIEDWSAISNHLYIWNYITNFMNYMLPHPNWRALAPDIRFFVNHNAIGLFEQGDKWCSVGDFVRPREWIVAHLQWNPELDERELMRKFFNGYYGAAGPHLIKYIDFLTETVTRKNFKLHYYSDRVSGWLSYDEMLEAEKIYAAAEEAVKDDPTCAKRVRRERIPLDLVRLMYATENGKAKRFLKEKAAPIPDNIMQLADEFVELTKNAGQYREGKAMGTYPDMIRNNLRQAIAPVTYVPEICKGKPLDSWDVFPAKGHRLHLGSCKLVNDPDAAVGQAIQMPGNTNEWGTQIPFPVQFYNADKQWKLVVRVRCDAAADDGNALSFGIYGTKLFFLTERVPVKQCKGQKYAVVETKPFSLKPLEGKNPFVWFAPPNRSLEEVAAVYIDEAVLMQVD